MQKEVLLSSAYLAPVVYYTKLYAYEKAYIERYDHYMKQTYRNRCVIASANGPLALTIPTEKADEAKCLMKDVRISDHGNWRHTHWNAFVAAYRQSPFFDYYADEFHRFYEQKYEFLYDFNGELCAWVCEQLDIQPVLCPTTDYVTEPQSVDDSGSGFIRNGTLPRRFPIFSSSVLPGVRRKARLPAEPEYRRSAVQHGAGRAVGASG